MTWIASRRDAASQDAADLSEKVERIVAAESSLARDACAVVTLFEDDGQCPRRSRSAPRQNHPRPQWCGGRALCRASHSGRSSCAARSTASYRKALSLSARSAHSSTMKGTTYCFVLLPCYSPTHPIPLQLRKALHVVIAGDGVTAPELVELAHQLGIENRLIMPGRVPRGDAKLWVQALDAVIVPRKDYEVTRMVTPQKPAEAMALGRPVIGSDLPALRETLEGVAAGEAGDSGPPR